MSQAWQAAMLKLLTLSEDQPAWPTARQIPASVVDAALSLMLRQLLCYPQSVAVWRCLMKTSST